MNRQIVPICLFFISNLRLEVLAMTKKVAIIMGSDSDLSVMMEAADKLKQFDIPYEVHIISAHLGGVLAAYTTLPVIGVPIKTSMMGGLDSLLSMVQMPSGVPVATVAVNGAANAAILAAQMLAISDAEVHAKLVTYKSDMEETVLEKDAKLQRELEE